MPALGYDDLEIAEGETASRVLMQLVADDPTLAMVRVLLRLRELAQPA